MIIYNKGKQKVPKIVYMNFKALLLIKEMEGKPCDSSWHVRKGQVGHEINNQTLKF